VTAREEIREGMIARLDQVLISCCIHDHRKQAEYIIDTKFIPYLHSQGVVIKTQGKLPPNIAEVGSEFYEGFKMAIKVMLEAGYVAVEPLIKEDSSADN